MSQFSNPSLRTNPFHTYRDPDTGQWVTVIPKPARLEELASDLTARRLRFIDSEDFDQFSSLTP